MVSKRITIRRKRRFKYLVKLTIFDSLLLAVFLPLLAIIATDINKSSDSKEISVSNDSSSSLTAGISKEFFDSLSTSSIKLDISSVEKEIVKQQNIIKEEQKKELENQYDNYVERHSPIDYSDNEEIYQEYIYPLAKIIYAEGGNMSDEFQRNVGYVVLNRIDSKYYPNTLNDVFFSDDAYAETSRERFLEEKVSEQALENAKIVINEYFNGTIPVCPAMVYQAEFKQGVDIFQIDNTYFGCNSRIHEDMEKEKEN